MDTQNAHRPGDAARLRRVGRGLRKRLTAMVRLSWNPLRLFYVPIALLIALTPIPVPNPL